MSLETKSVMTLANLGSGGFSVQSSAGFEPGTVMRFRFSTPDGVWSTLLTAQSVYKRPDPEAPQGKGFLTGFKFLNVEMSRVAVSINALIDRATAVISFS